MQKLLQVDFDFTGPFGDEMSAMLVGLAESINHEPGMIWKIWTENQKAQLGGGIYLFENEAYAQTYLEMHSARLKKMGVTDIRGYIFDINAPLSAINRAPTTGVGSDEQ
ncbi:monooxygenase [Moritella sp. F3]|uniref:monooxygenase n=1 Tax=Moritella sp. F3 TaxID=2718882 RepID=UPI0018E11CB8|nr:monooxygenase [Moritella sp. F3]GIC77895.1 monooxygenase [Moritella sp. F1]GIC82416.1 monooxygenase [Moritella sp. F3]